MSNSQEILQQRCFDVVDNNLIDSGGCVLIKQAKDRWHDGTPKTLLIQELEEKFGCIFQKTSELYGVQLGKVYLIARGKVATFFAPVLIQHPDKAKKYAETTKNVEFATFPHNEPTPEAVEKCKKEWEFYLRGAAFTNKSRYSEDAQLPGDITVILLRLNEEASAIAEFANAEILKAQSEGDFKERDLGLVYKELMEMVLMPTMVHELAHHALEAVTGITIGYQTHPKMEALIEEMTSMILSKNNGTIYEVIKKLNDMEESEESL